MKNDCNHQSRSTMVPLAVTAAFIFGCLLLSAWLLEGEQRPHQRAFGKEESGQHIFCALCENKLFLRWIKHKKTWTWHVQNQIPKDNFSKPCLELKVTHQSQGWYIMITSSINQDFLCFCFSLNFINKQFSCFSNILDMSSLFNSTVTSFQQKLKTMDIK